jgi:hypothetical protein
MSATNPAPVKPPDEAIPVERLIKSMQPVSKPVQPGSPAASKPANPTGILPE